MLRKPLVEAVEACLETIHPGVETVHPGGKVGMHVVDAGMHVVDAGVHASDLRRQQTVEHHDGPDGPLRVAAHRCRRIICARVRSRPSGVCPSQCTHEVVMASPVTRRRGAGSGLAELDRPTVPSLSAVQPTLIEDSGDQIGRRRALDDPVADLPEALGLGDAGQRRGQQLAVEGLELVP